MLKDNYRHAIATCLVTLATLSVAGCGTATRTDNGLGLSNTVGAKPSTTTKPSSSKPKNTGQGNTAAPSPGHWPQISVTSVATLPQGILGNALVIGPNGDPISVGGYTGIVSIRDIYRLLPTVSVMAQLPVPTHDAAAGFLGNTLYVFGGGQATSYNTIVAVDQGRSKVVGTLSQPLSDAVSVPLAVKGSQGLALVGGYNGSVYRKDVAFVSEDSNSQQRKWSTLFNLATDVRYGAVASSGSNLYIAGGLEKTQSLSNRVYAWSSKSGKLKQVAMLPEAVQKAALFATGPYLLLVGGETASGKPLQQIIAIDTRTGQTKVVGQLATPLADMGYAQTSKMGYLAGGVTAPSDNSTSRRVLELKWKW